MNGRILAIDPGEKRIGVAIGDPTGTIASPLTVVQHIARVIDAATIAKLAADHDAVKIVIGQALDSEGEVGPAGRKASRLAEAISLQTNLPVELWDESGSTQIAREASLALGKPKHKRKGHFDDIAAVVILQSYLEAHRGE